jgi:dTDP-4-amino-4,6-dideoxygalactose transaminase
MRIPYGKQFLDELDYQSVLDALRSEWLTTGPYVEKFENLLSQIVGAPTICVSSGTAALHCAYAAIQLEAGDEVITPPITFIGTQATAYQMGAKILFADVQEDTGNIDPKSVESLITPRTKAIVAVDFAGHPADLFELRAIADKYKIYLIEDAAHSLGSKYHDIPVGGIADITTFSFFPTKNITTAEGGAVASINSELLERARKFSRQGLIRDEKNFKIKTEGPWHQEVHNFGLNYRLPDVLCALGVSQLKKIPQFKKQRNKIFDNYSSSIEENENLKLPVCRKYVDPMWHLYPVKINPVHRRFVFEKLRENNIMVQVNYLPVYWHPVFENLGFKRGLCPISENFYLSEISIPIYPGLELKNQNCVIGHLNEIIRMID